MKETKMSEKLLPCPFCGGEAYYRTPHKAKGTAFVVVGVECRKCGAAPFATMTYEGNSREEMNAVAAKHWNRRADK